MTKAKKSSSKTLKAKAKKLPAKKAPAKKNLVKKLVAKKSTSKKPTSKKVLAKKAVIKKVLAKKLVTKKILAKKTIVKKADTKKTVIKKAITKKLQAKKPALNKVPAQKEAHKKNVDAIKYSATQPFIKKEPYKASVVIRTADDVKFNIGDFAVYPAHGVGRIEAMESKTIMGEKMDFLVINILDTGMNVLVPVSNIRNVGLRPVIKGNKVKDVFEVLKNRKRTVTSSTWNRRYREYMEKIKSGSIFEIAEVLRDLLVLKTAKELSFGERKMLDTAKNLLVKELAVAKEVDEKKVELEVQKMFFEAKKELASSVKEKPDLG
jgi:CarD family transcriptional regulator